MDDKGWEKLEVYIVKNSTKKSIDAGAYRCN